MHSSGAHNTVRAARGLLAERLALSPTAARGLHRNARLGQCAGMSQEWCQLVEPTGQSN
jgi:hypothetical protein